MHLKRFKRVYITGLVLLALLIVGGWYWWMIAGERQGESSKEELDKIKAGFSYSPTSYFSIPSSDKSWTKLDSFTEAEQKEEFLYENREFYFYYPSFWVFENEMPKYDPNTVQLSIDIRRISEKAISQKYDIHTYIKDLLSDYVPSKKITINGKIVYIESFPPIDEGGGSIVSYVAFDDDDLIIFSLGRLHLRNWEKEEQIIEQTILYPLINSLNNS